jgi:uncharacterized repeat protein (TIGR03803 family)
VSVVLSLAIVLIPVVVATQTAQGRAYKILHRFKGVADGASPEAGLIQDMAGNLYGTAVSGGGTGCFGGQGCGTVFKLDVTGKFTVLHRFTGKADGAYPNGLIRDQAGNFYGTTGAGGPGRCYFRGHRIGCGIVFKLDTTGKETVLYSFSGNPDGVNPFGGVIPDTAGNLYGTTYNGGVHGYGTVFELSTAGKESVLYSFTGGADGANPNAGLVRDNVGNLYGTTIFIGSNPTGVVFKLSKHKETVLYSFNDGTDGGQPSGLIRDKAGNLYGTTFTGGNLPCGQITNGCGTVFELDATGRETVLYSFLGWPDGQLPFAPLIMDKAGDLYGNTSQGGVYGYGTVFKLNQAGNETVLHNFKGPDGASPGASLIQDGNNNLYGTTMAGGGTACGGNGCGVVFGLIP